YLHNMLIVFYKINSTEATAMLKKLNIYHPYGKTGDLSSMSDRSGEGIDFGVIPTEEIIISIMPGIRTFNEEMQMSGTDLQEIETKFLNTNQVVFLGFAFHKMN